MRRIYANRWVLRRALAWFCAVVGVAGLYATPVRHEGWRLWPLVFAAMLLFGAYLAWKDAR